MRLWLRVRRVAACLGTILALAVVLIPARQINLPMPDFLEGTGASVPLSFFLPLAVSIAVAWGLTTGDTYAESVACRPVRLLDAAYVFFIGVLALATFTVARAIGGTDLALAAGRNSIGYLGLMLVGRKILGSNAAPLLPAGFALTAAIFGRDRMLQTRWWAWPIAPADEVFSWGAALVVFVAGFAMMMWRDTAIAADI